MNTEKSLLISLRRWIGISIIAMIPCCVLIGLFGYKWTNDMGMWYQSTSAMYWSSCRNIFVGMLFMDAIFFIIYKGYNWKDRFVNIATGIFMLGLILFPSNAEGVALNNFPRYFEVFPFIPVAVCDKIHIICAMGIFFVQTFNIAFLFTKQEGEITDKKKQRNIVYKVCAIVAVVLLIVNQTSIYMATHGFPAIRGTCLGLIIQCLAFVDIGVAWLVKGEGLILLNDK